MKIITVPLIKNHSFDYEPFDPGKLTTFFLSIYFVLSFFEAYLNSIIGSTMKYYLLFLIILLLLSFEKIKFRSSHFLIFAWLLYKIASILWAPYNSNDVLSAHFISQIGMVGFFIVMTLVEFNKEFVIKMVDVSLYSSIVLGTLSLFFSEPYSGNSSRMALKLFGYQNDPNNLSAFYLIGITIALYYILFERKKIKSNSAFVTINCLAMGMTASRAGLITLVIIVAIMIVISNKEEKKLKNFIIRILTLVVFLVLIFLISKWFLPTEAYQRLFIESYEGASGRQLIWEQAIYLFKSKPLFGSGWGFYAGAHNTFLTMLIDIGIFGTMIFITLMIQICNSAIKNKQLLPLLLLFAGFIPSLSIDAINKRFFWNAIILSSLIIFSKLSWNKE